MHVAPDAISHTRTFTCIQHMPASPHAHRTPMHIHPPPETKQAQQYKSHPTTHTTQLTKTTMHTVRGTSQASTLAVDPQIARRHLSESKLHDQQSWKTRPATLVPATTSNKIEPMTRANKNAPNYIYIYIYIYTYTYIYIYTHMYIYIYFVLCFLFRLVRCVKCKHPERWSLGHCMRSIGNLR